METYLAQSLAFGLPDETLRRSVAMGEALQDAERRLRETQSLLQMAAQLGRLGAWSYEAGHERVMWSAEACAIHEVAPGYAPTPEESIAFFAPEYRECAAARVSACLTQGTPFDLEAEIITARGRRVWVRTLGEAEWDEHGVVRKLQGALQDISEGKRAAERELRLAEQLAATLERRVGERTAQLELANKELEAFSYSIAHDLRAPLGSIDGFSKMLREAAGTQLPEPCGHYLDRIRAGVRQMSQMTDALLALAGLSRASFQPEDVDLAVIAASAFEECRKTSERDVHVRVAPSMPAWADVRLITLAFTQLASNAFKFTAGAEWPRVEAGMVEGDGGEPVYFVRDNGAGFDMAYASKLFEPFHRLHAAARDDDGTGIGLAIVRKAVTRHGGRIWAQAAPGEGATFFFTLPSQPRVPS